MTINYIQERKKEEETTEQVQTSTDSALSFVLLGNQN
jgi:hypothetical protein